MSSIWRPVRERNPARSLMVVVAHPGDEAFGFAGAITDAVAAGAYVVVVCATRGFFDPRLLDKAPAPGGRNRSYAKPVVWRNIDNVREDEMRRSVALLGVRVLRMLDYAEDTLDKIDFDELVSRIVEPIRMHRPEVLITFGADGVTGDRDHQAISRAVDLAFDAAGRPLSYEDDLEEDQAAWRCAKLYHLILPAEKVALLGDAAPDQLLTLDVSRPTLHLELGELAGVKLAAINRHVSQTGSSGAFADWTPEVRDRFLASEDYRLVRSNLPVAAGASLSDGERGLFDGLP